MNYKILKEEVVFESFLKIKKATVEYDTFSGDKQVTEKLCLERGDSVAALIYEKDTDSILMINQFRYPITKNKIGWLLEIVAGTVKEGEDPSDCIAREIEEEIGYVVADTRLIQNFYVSPGSSAERVFLYYTEVGSNQKLSKGGGADDEDEDIQLVKVPISEIQDRLDQQTIIDAKSVVALQWFLLNKTK